MIKKIDLDVSPILDVLEDFDALNDGRARQFITNDIAKRSEPYTPKQTGILLNTMHVTPKTIVYNEPYATFLWYGKLMLGEETHSPFARKDERKYVTDTNLHYHGESKRGAFWTERMWAEEQDMIIEDLVGFLMKRGY